jgi:Amt family ammonium transporter
MLTCTSEPRHQLSCATCAAAPSLALKNKGLTWVVDVENLNQWYQSGDQAYIIVASAMVLIMVPGLGFLYSGLARRKSALSLIWACMASCSVITFQWYFWGYSLAFSQYATNGFIGDLKKFGLMKTLGAPSPGSPLVPDLLYAFYQVRDRDQVSLELY